MTSPQSSMTYLKRLCGKITHFMDYVPDHPFRIPVITIGVLLLLLIIGGALLLMVNLRIAQLDEAQALVSSLWIPPRKMS